MPLRDLKDRSPGSRCAHSRRWASLGPSDGKPTVVGPGYNGDQLVVPTVRTLGDRKQGDLVPITHASSRSLATCAGMTRTCLATRTRHRLVPVTAGLNRLGQFQHPLSAREFGSWTEHRVLVEHAEQFLVTAMRFSEKLDPGADWFQPDLASVENDDEASREILAEMHGTTATRTTSAEAGADRAFAEERLPNCSSHSVSMNPVWRGNSRRQRLGADPRGREIVVAYRQGRPAFEASGSRARMGRMQQIDWLDWHAP